MPTGSFSWQGNVWKIISSCDEKGNTCYFITKIEFDICEKRHENKWNIACKKAIKWIKSNKTQ